ncbi:MAG: ATP-binding protein [Simkaniaceae bacterium]|nr:ATP-binding protein [Simkaniaceae bacterium]
MYHVESKRFNAELKRLPKMMKWIQTRLARCGFESAETKKIELAVEEALVNIVHYAYGDARGEIEIDFEGDQGNLTLVIRDWGIPFNPLEHKSEIHSSASLEERKIGGLGIGLIFNLMDDVHYQRKGSCNYLTLVRRLQSDRSIV